MRHTAPAINLTFHATIPEIIYIYDMAFNGRFALSLAQFATQDSDQLQTLIDVSGKTIADLDQENCVISDTAYNQIIEAAVHQSADPFFGLHAGEHLNLAAAGLIGQITQTSSTVKEALQYCCDFANLGCSALPMKLHKVGAHYQLTLTPNVTWKNQSDQSFRHTTEGVLAFTIREIHALALHQHDPIAISVTWAKPLDTTEYTRVFGCSVQFDRSEIAILLDTEQVEAPIATSNYNLLRILVAHAQEKSTLLERQNGYAIRIKQTVIHLMQPSFPTIDQVARHLNLSVRTLQRRLKKEGIIYKYLIDDLRKECALSYLKRPDLNISDIAFLLNYADTSAFTRSFKRWTGKVPRQYRNK